VWQEAVSVDMVKKTLHIKKLTTGEEYDESFDKLILASGASPRKVLFEGLDTADNVYYLRSMEDVDEIFSALEKTPERALVVGGGFIGVETAENLAERGLKVTLIEVRDQILPSFDHEMAPFLQNELKRNGVDLKTGVSLKSFADKGQKITLTNGDMLEEDLVILSIGVVPENSLAKSAGLKLTKDGYVVTNEKWKLLTRPPVP
jgi:NADPH-dependent 2,4-dienoyl-CoA reductase/sulfur reductase-like enzyme